MNPKEVRQLLSSYILIPHEILKGSKVCYVTGRTLLLSPAQYSLLLSETGASLGNLLRSLKIVPLPPEMFSLHFPVFDPPPQPSFSEVDPTGS